MGKDLKGKELGVGITQRKNGTYQGRFKDRFGNYQTIYAKKISELRKELAIKIAENENFTGIRENVKLDSWFNEWIRIYKEKVSAPNTIRAYTCVYNKSISPFLGNRNINSLVKTDIQKVISFASEKGYSYEWQKKIKTIMKDMLERALEDNLILRNPAKGTRIIAEKENKSRALSVEEQNIFFKYCKNTFYDNLFNVAVNTGMRPGELFALTEDDIDFENGFIYVSKTLVYQKYLTDSKHTFHIEVPKTKTSNRKVPINSVCRMYLEKQICQKSIISSKNAKEQNEYLFTTKFNTPLNSTTYTKAINAIVREINVLRPSEDLFSEFTGHTFRHTFATRCFECGIDPKVVQSYLGHSSVNITLDLYTHVTEEKSSIDIEKIVDCMDNNIVDFKRKIS